MSATDKAIEILGEEKVGCVRDLFESLEGQPPEVLRLRYRADNKIVLELLDYLESPAQLIRYDKKHENYRVSPYALPLVRNEKSKRIVTLMREVYRVLKVLYLERLDARITFEELFEKVELSKSEFQEVVYYMFEAHDVWSSKSIDFPFGDEASFCISESVIKRNDFLDVLEDYYRWNLFSAGNNFFKSSSNELIGQPGSPKTLFDDIKNKAHNNPVIVSIIIAATLLSFTLGLANNLGGIIEVLR